MIIVRHRVNDVGTLKNTNSCHGVEIDLRSGPEGVYVAHESFVSGQPLREWLGSYQHRLLILNVKEDGLEEAVMESLNSHQVQNYFFLDQALPTLIRRGLGGQFDSAIRVSEYESFDTVWRLARFSSWLWVDFFHQPKLAVQDLHRARGLGLKICLVSPELHDIQRAQEISTLKQQLSNSNLEIDAVCTKFPEIWEAW